MSQKKSRLNLNFQLSLRTERVQYVRDYLAAIPFEPNEDELDLIAKYILWGKKSESERDGQARLKSDGFSLESKSSVWSSNNSEESLDALLENPAFNEGSLSLPPTRRVRETFSRQSVRKSAPAGLLDSFETLWRNIDEAELQIALYELAHSKRKQIRQPLLDRFSPEDLTSIQKRAASLNAFTYLKMRHQLVELRQQQYTLKDSYASPIQKHETPDLIAPDYETFSAIFPLFIPPNIPLFKKIFNSDRMPCPSDLTQDDLKSLSTYLWANKTPTHNIFDFTNPDYLYAFYSTYNDLKYEVTDVPIESLLPTLLRLSEIYRSLAHLDPLHSRILDLKILHYPNQDISSLINKEFNKSYNPNYISTLYCKKCLAAIANAARIHRDVCENLFFPENFKKCKDCGQTFLVNEQNFVRRARSNDGFSPRCKSCEKILRAKRSQK